MNIYDSIIKAFVLRGECIEQLSNCLNEILDINNSSLKEKDKKQRINKLVSYYVKKTHKIITVDINKVLDIK